MNCITAIGNSEKSKSWQLQIYWNALLVRQTISFITLHINSTVFTFIKHAQANIYTHF